MEDGGLLTEENRETPGVGMIQESRRRNGRVLPGNLRERNKGRINVLSGVREVHRLKSILLFYTNYYLWVLFFTSTVRTLLEPVNINSTGERWFYQDYLQSRESRPSESLEVRTTLNTGTRDRTRLAVRSH